MLLKPNRWLYYWRNGEYVAALFDIHAAKKMIKEFYNYENYFGEGCNPNGRG